MEKPERPTFDEFAKVVAPLNPGASREDIKQAYFQRFHLRQDGTPKGEGFFGRLPRTGSSGGDYSTELSASVTIGGKNLFFPTLVPGLTREEIDHLLAGKQPTDAIYDKAIRHAQTRIAQGLSPFASPGEQIQLPDKAAGSGLAGSIMKR